jgi:alpha-tubulin suppressor-like RCC1 family protein
MKKIIQIAISNDDTLCLTEDGKVYQRSVKDRQEFKEEPSKEYPHGRVYIKGTYYWQEMPEEESF